MKEKTKDSSKFKAKLKDKKIRRVGIVSALITGIALAILAFLGTETADVPHLFFKIIPTLFAFLFGAAIGGGIGVWICEVNEEEE